MPKEVIIGDQVWTAQNLNVDKFRNGDSIPRVKTAEGRIKPNDMKQPAWCYYENKSENGTSYGKLFNWYAVNDPGGLAPIGWHIPSDSELVQLNTFIEKNYSSSSSQAKKLKSAYCWYYYQRGTDQSGFAGLYGGYRSQYWA